MKIRKSTIVWFVLAVLLVASQIFETDNSDEKMWADATYVKDAKVLPENEGKFVAVSGTPRMLEPVVDENVGVTLQSPKVYRLVEIIEWDNSANEWRTKMVSTGSTEDGYETGTMVGRVAIGDFELDEELIVRLNVIMRSVEKEDFSDEDIAHMENTGYLVRSGGDFCYSDVAHQLLEGLSPTIEDLDESDYLWHPEWDDTYLVSWDMWVPDSDEELTVVGIQEGNTLTYCQVEGGVSKDHTVSEEELNDSVNPVHVKYVAFATALLFVLLGVRSMFKKKKDK